MKYNNDGDRCFTYRTRKVLQARAKVAENKVNGPEDSIVSEMVKQQTQRKSKISRVASRSVLWSWTRLRVPGGL